MIQLIYTVRPLLQLLDEDYNVIKKVENSITTPDGFNDDPYYYNFIGLKDSTFDGYKFTTNNVDHDIHDGMNGLHVEGDTTISGSLNVSSDLIIGSLNIRYEHLCKYKC